MDEVTKLEIARVNDENARQNHRLDLLESDVKAFQKIAISVEKMAASVESLAKEMQENGARLDRIEKAPLESVGKVKAAAISAVVGVVFGALAIGIIQMISQNVR